MKYLLLLFIVLMAVGCVGEDPQLTHRHRLIAARTVYTSTSRVLADAIRRGRFDQDEAAEVVFWVRFGNEVLDEYEAAIMNGTANDRARLYRRLQAVLDQLEVFVQQAKEKDDVSFVSDSVDGRDFGTWVFDRTSDWSGPADPPWRPGHRPRVGPGEARSQGSRKRRGTGLQGTVWQGAARTAIFA